MLKSIIIPCRRAYVFQHRKQTRFSAFFELQTPKHFPGDTDPWLANLSLMSTSLLSLATSQGVFRRAWGSAQKPQETRRGVQRRHERGMGLPAQLFLQRACSSRGAFHFVFNSDPHISQRLDTHSRKVCRDACQPTSAHPSLLPQL